MIGLFWVMLIVAGLGFILGYYIERKFWSAVGGAAIGAFLSGFICIFIVMVLKENPDSVEEVARHTTNIHSLREANTGLQGSFFLGSGSIGSTWYYQAYVNTDDGFHKEKFDQDITYIKETNSVAPKVEKYKLVTHRNWLDAWISGNPTSESRYYTKYILYVPEGAIIKEFRLE